MKPDLLILVSLSIASGAIAVLVTGLYFRWRMATLPRGMIAIEASTVSGRGAFATLKIREGAIIERCPAIEVSEGDVGGELVNYVFYGSTEKRRLVAMGYGMLFNHSADPNVAYYREDGPLGLELILYALRDIAKGEELFYNYGEDWWITRK
ncbi:MAG: SET domain-containing protein [Chlorobiaceae bacterium]